MANGYVVDVYRGACVADRDGFVTCDGVVKNDGVIFGEDMVKLVEMD